MDESEIKEEVEHPGDIKVKLEANLSSVVYEVQVTSTVDIKPKKEDPSQNHFPAVTKQEIQTAKGINIKQDHDLTSDDIEIEQESKNTSDGEYEIESESDSNREHPQQIPRISQASSTRSNQIVSKRKKRAVKIEKKELLQCTLCPESFPNVRLLITHTRNEHATIANSSSSPLDVSDDKDEALLQCPLCSKSLTFVSNLHRHFLGFHINNKPFQCYVCLESSNEIKNFPTETFLKEHIKAVHPARYKFQCDICSHKFVRFSHYKHHKETHIEKQYKCEYCSKIYRNKESMLRHIIAVHKEYTDRHETFKCDECEQLFCSQKKLEFHILQMHIIDTFQCKICFKKFRMEVELNKHSTIAHKENRTWLVCDVCFKAFKNNEELVRHLEVEHKRFFKCRKCFRSFDSKEEHDSHSTEIIDEEGGISGKPQLQCKVCLVILNSECAFTTHKDTHQKTGEIGSKNVLLLQPGVARGCPHRCDFCPKTFEQKSYLLEHAMECHPNEKKWECKSCGKSFNLKYQLIQHEMLHSINKPFECKVCKKCFTSMHLLKMHERIHKKIKKYQCSKCKKFCTTNRDLTQHIANQHGGVKPFKCNICKKTFASKSLLVRHSVVHTDERPFSCSKCSYSCKRGFNLRRHKRSIHSKNPTNKYRKTTSHPGRGGPHLKCLKNLVYICCLEECAFETTDKKEVALHYAKHNLPKVVLPRLLHGPSCEVFLSQSTPTNKHAIQALHNV